MKENQTKRGGKSVGLEEEDDGSMIPTLGSRLKQKRQEEAIGEGEEISHIIQP